MEADETNICNNSDIWEWQEDDYCLKETTKTEISRCLWDEVNQSEDSLIYLLEEQTPVKECTDFVYQTPRVEENINKLEECRDSSQQKRRRVLHFSHESSEASICNVQPTSVFIRSKEREDEQIDDGPSASTNADLNSQWDIGFSGSCAFNSEAWDQPTEGWLDECLDSGMLHCKIDETTASAPDMNCDEASIQEGDRCTELCNFSSDTELYSAKEPRLSSLAILLKGKNSFLETSTKLTTSVAYPFALIKPCGVEGDLTLKDINQKLHMPLSSRLKATDDENSSGSYPTSAFSGKPVVVKTKIRTEGGKGSITIMRTKG